MDKELNKSQRWLQYIRKILLTNGLEMVIFGGKVFFPHSAEFNFYQLNYTFISIFESIRFCLPNSSIKTIATICYVASYFLVLIVFAGILKSVWSTENFSTHIICRFDSVCFTWYEIRLQMYQLFYTLSKLLHKTFALFAVTFWKSIRHCLSCHYHVIPPHLVELPTQKWMYFNS